MTILLKNTIAVSAGLLLSLTASAYAADTPFAKKQIVEKIVLEKIQHDNPSLKIAALQAGIRAYEHLQAKGQIHKPLLTLVDFTEASAKKRLWVLDMEKGTTEYFTYVAQGSTTGWNIAHYFSNEENSHASSIGVYLTGSAYYGTVGYAMRLYGLDRDFNSNAYKRGVVMHSAWHISDQYALMHGRIGNTWGCFGLSKVVADDIINKINNGTVMVAYYPDSQWLATSPYEQAL
ncbi:MAG: murein L,D-transpeptidase catalytic domain family protein [Gammaproteobacteria bacterium]|nr:murein L,D-transpeptidase catalytic domain family protein [Gammaproteobacteria bacterium]MBY0544844.1 murein L,D-transpeptidase catalytic domain family protein [Gammaproteobacteria bacterium]